MFYVLMYRNILNLRLIQILLQEQGHGHTIEQTHLHVLVINSNLANCTTHSRVVFIEVKHHHIL